MTLGDKKEVTVGEFIDAIEQNGFRQARGEWIRYSDSGYVNYACAMGQACINLEVSYQDVRGRGFSSGVFSDIRSDTHEWNLTGYIMDLNDVKRLSCKEIAKRVREKFSHSLHKKVSFSTHKYPVKE